MTKKPDGRYNNLQRFTISPLLCLGLLTEVRVDGMFLDVMCPLDRRLTMFRGQLVPFEVGQRLFPVTEARGVKHSFIFSRQQSVPECLHLHIGAEYRLCRIVPM